MVDVWDVPRLKKREKKEKTWTDGGICCCICHWLHPQLEKKWPHQQLKTQSTPLPKISLAKKYNKANPIFLHVHVRSSFLNRKYVLNSIVMNILEPIINRISKIHVLTDVVAVFYVIN